MSTSADTRGINARARIGICTPENFFAISPHYRHHQPVLNEGQELTPRYLPHRPPPERPPEQGHLLLASEPSAETYDGRTGPDKLLRHRLSPHRLHHWIPQSRPPTSPPCGDHSIQSPRPPGQFRIGNPVPTGQIPHSWYQIDLRKPAGHWPHSIPTKPSPSSQFLRENSHLRCTACLRPDG